VGKSKVVTCTGHESQSTGANFSFMESLALLFGNALHFGNESVVFLQRDWQERHNRYKWMGVGGMR
jgi:hypothetical protein